MFFLSACKKNITTNDFFTIDGVSYISYSDFSRAFPFKVSKDNDYVYMNQNNVNVSLKIGTRFVFQYGNLVDSNKYAVLSKDGEVFIPVNFLDEYLGLNGVYSEARQSSLYTSCKFLPSQVIYAINNPKEQSSKKILQEVSMPVYKGYEGYYIDLNRVISFEEFPANFSKEHEKIINESGFSKQELNFSEYMVIENSRFINQFNMESMISDPSFENQDTSLWTIDDYNSWLKTRHDLEFFNSIYSSPDDLRGLYDLELSMKDAVNIYTATGKKVNEMSVEKVHNTLGQIYASTVDKVMESSKFEK